MTQRVVWIFCLAVALISMISVGYQLVTDEQFDANAWRAAPEEGGFLDRRGMMKDVRAMLASGTIGSRESAQRILGNPDRMAEGDANVWFYNLGGQHSAAAPESADWLELTFDSNGKLLRHRVMQEMIVPLRR